MKLLGLVICLLCVNYLEAIETYRAAVVNYDKEITESELAPFIYEAGHMNVDILVLPSPNPAETLDSYDETVKSLSKAADHANLYVVAHLHEKTRCQNNFEVVRSNLVFDKEGSIISSYRKPISNLANCSSSASELVTFTTDFGVTFGLLMDEDIVLHNAEYMKGLKNFIMAGTGSDTTFLSAASFSSFWTFVNNANLIASNGIYVGKSGLRTNSDRLVSADLDKNGGSEDSAVLLASSSYKLSSEDLSQYILKPLDLEASVQGYKDTVCHRSFCCEFYIKTGAADVKSEVSYNLAAFNGVHRFTAQNNIGVQNCAIFACVDERTCERPSNNTNILFEKISIAANFTKQNAQYPIVHTTSVLPTENFKFQTNTNGKSTQVTLEIVDGQNILTFGMFGRDFSKDYESFSVQRDGSESTYNIYDLIFNEEVQEFFDYVWIRLRILIVVVSIYVLEML